VFLVLYFRRLYKGHLEGGKKSEKELRVKRSVLLAVGLAAAGQQRLLGVRAAVDGALQCLWMEQEEKALAYSIR